MAIGLLSGSSKNTSSPKGFANSPSLQFQLGPSPAQDTGFTVIGDTGSKVTYVSSLGNLQFNRGTVFSNIQNQDINFVGTGTGNVIVSGLQRNISTNTGVLVVKGGIGIANGLYTGEDINVNGLTIGRGYDGTNNIVITGAARQITNDVDFDGENSISIGWSALTNISSAQNSIAIGRYAMSSGSNLTNTIAIGDSSLQRVGSIISMPVGNISAISVGTMTVVTVVNHQLSTGSAISIIGLGGTLGANLNGKNYLARAITPNNLLLYDFVANDNTYDLAVNSIYSLIDGKNPLVDSTGWSGSVTSSTVSRQIVTYANVGLGTNAGQSFYNGQHNFFIGNNSAPNLTTGSFNFFIGYEVSTNMITGDNNISFNSKVLQNGRSNQIGFGNVFYFDGISTTTIGSSLFVSDSNYGNYYNESTGFFNSTGALRVNGGAGIRGSLHIGANLTVTNSGTVTLSPSTGTVTINPASTGTIDNMSIGATVAGPGVFTTVNITNTASSTGGTTGALQVLGGVGVVKNIHVGTSINVDTANVRSTASSTSTTTGAVTVVGGVGVRGSVYSKDGNPYQNNLLYSPKVTVGATVPLNPNIADFWINTNNLGEYQYILDGTSTFWIQIAQL
jgi:hypothetical protein